GDLYSKHILVGPGLRVCMLDWQRARKWKQVPWARRCRDLAALDATLPESLASNSLRLACLRSYLQATGGTSLKAWAIRIRLLSMQLQRKHRIRALRRMPLPPGSQNLVWLDGEAMCVSRSFHQEIDGKIPSWLRFRGRQESHVESCRIQLASGRVGSLVR